MAPRVEKPRKTNADLRRERDLNVATHRLRSAMSGIGDRRVTLKNGAELVGVPTRVVIDKSLEGRKSNLRIFMCGYDFPMDDVATVT